MSKSKEERMHDSASKVEVQPTGESGEDEKSTEEAPDQAATEEESPKASETELLEQRVKELEEQNAELQGELLRKQADFENFRKRMFRERQEAVEYANSKLLLDLVDVIDNFERAIKSSDDSQDFKSFHEGIELIEKQFTSMLENKWGLKRFDSVGEEFDPEKHEALMAEERDDVETETVMEDFQKGYMLHDRVLRHAKVKVAKPAGGGESRGDVNAQSGGSDNQENKDS